MSRPFRFLTFLCAVAMIATQAQSKPQHGPRSETQSAAPLSKQTAREASTHANANAFVSTVMLGDLGFGSGIRLANLGERRDVFVAMPEGAEISANELVLSFDDLSAYEARRSLEILVNDRTAASISLDGHSTDRVVHVTLAGAKPQHGYLKLTFLYSGAATPDRCIDVRYVGDSLVIRPESKVAFDVDFPGAPDVGTTAALLPRDVTLVLPRRDLVPSDVATALTLARALTASGRHVAFQVGFDKPHEAPQEAQRLWTRGLIFLGSLDEVSGLLEAPLATVAGTVPAFGTVAAVRIAGFPALVVSDVDAGRAARLFGSADLSATRGVAEVSVGNFAAPSEASDNISFDQLGLKPAPVDVFGRAELSVAIASRDLPPETRATGIVLELMAAPDPTGEKAVVSAYVNDRLLASTVAASGGPTRLSIGLPDGLVGKSANVLAVVQRRSEQGDCRFQAQGYPAQILPSSEVLLKATTGAARAFSDLTPRWANGIEILIARPALYHPDTLVAFLTGIVSDLSAQITPITVQFIADNAAPDPRGPFIAISTRPPAGIIPEVRFDRGRVVVADHSGHTLLDLGGFVSGAVAQVVSDSEESGIWIRPLAHDGALPSPVALNLDRGNVAFIDQTGVALAMSTEHESVAQITYPDQISWLSIAEEFRAWIVGGLWVLATFVFLAALKRVLRRRPSAPSE